MADPTICFDSSARVVTFVCVTRASQVFAGAGGVSETASVGTNSLVSVAFPSILRVVDLLTGRLRYHTVTTHPFRATFISAAD